MNSTTPIIAIATASGRASVGIIRISGKNILPIVEAICGKLLNPRHATYLAFLDQDGQAIDHGLAIYFPAPHSYTGEDILELQAHGGPVVLQMLIKRCLNIGKSLNLRLAEPGEFTKRAFINEKVDLAQAEAVIDLIEASTEMAVKSANRSMEGKFSSRVNELVGQLIRLRTLVEATLDFPEEEIDFLKSSQALEQLESLQIGFKALLAEAKQGALLREGLQIVIAGQPNVGKSSLLNALTGMDLAIVTPIAGTTRDKVSQTIQIEGIPLHITDTAGLRDAIDSVEQIGIERSWQEIRKADVILHMMDISIGLTENDKKIAADFPADIPVLQILNKLDLATRVIDIEETTIQISAKTGLGIDVLKNRLLEIAGWQSGHESIFIARQRHIVALIKAQQHLIEAADFADQGDQHLELFAEELRLSQESLSSITGRFTADDLLGEIFTSFCIGK
ncbi:tRNA uridine-5-carboxymethylaminomethyl(34) synthesis GTPase MnmE [Ampullimonas aquatilis]|uniref:tRNA uridine-5-carboxymethylaminomethyl(34) synthesis GTPase MnmE n=1 Tax=Ampullimonas aquatilis TaxID=1341549 RepID=UPI003C765BE4